MNYKKSINTTKIIDGMEILISQIEDNSDPFAVLPPIKTRGIDRIMSKELYRNELYSLYCEQSAEGYTGENNIGDILQGTITNINSSEIWIEPHGKSRIICLTKNESPQLLNELHIGQLIDVCVVDVIYKPSFYILGNLSKIWFDKMIVDISEDLNDVIIEADVIKWAPQGYTMQFTHKGITHNAFMPNTYAGINKLVNPESIVGKTLKVKVDFYSGQNGNWVLSHKAYLETLINEKLETLDKSIKYSGKVTGTTSFGVFVEFEYCLTGMIHKANLASEYVNNYTDVFKPGTDITFWVKEILGRKLILTQVIRQSKWDTIKVNDILEGKVLNVRSFGALITLDEETMGLVKTSDIEKKKIDLNVGQTIKVKVINISREDRKIELSFV